MGGLPKAFPKVVLGFLCLASCKTPYFPENSRNGYLSTSKTTSLHLYELEKPGVPSNWLELKKLSKAEPTPRNSIRQGFLYLKVKRPEKAKIAFDRALYSPGVSKETEAIAWYGKTLAFLDMGLFGRAVFSRKRALSCTMDPVLAARLKNIRLNGYNWSRTGGRKGRGNGHGATTWPIQVHSRKEWKAMEPDRKRLKPMGRIFRITIHHSGFPCPYTDMESVERHILTIQKNHKRRSTRGARWGDLGYHFIIDPAGRIWEGRNIKYQGAHAGNNALNKGNIGICLLGNFCRTAPSRKQVQSLERLLELLMHRYRISPTHIYSHKELKNTACPGKYLQREIERIRARLLSRMN